MNEIEATDVEANGVAAASDEDLRGRAAASLAAARVRTTGLTDAVDDADLVAQHSPLMSPLVWDLAHIGSQEELWLVRDVGGREPLRPEIDGLYDAFQHSRASRVELPLLGPAEARAYVAEVRDKALDTLERTALTGRRLVEGGFAFGMIVQHEQQHAETMLATHQLRTGAPVLTAEPPPPGRALPAREVLVPAGPFGMGTSTEPWALDNERPAHVVDLPAFVIDAAPVSNGEYAEFIAAGGYQDRRWWSEPGWTHRSEVGLAAPRFWARDADGTWYRRRFGVQEPVPPDQPVVHVCWHEAQAYARWAGKRLPTEAEWEKAAAWDLEQGTARRHPWGDAPPTPELANLDQCTFSPAAIGAYPRGVSYFGCHQMLGDVWEWTASEFAPYPGFVPFPYPEYSEAHFGKGYKVLRGGSWATQPLAARNTFRNWDLPQRRQIFAGFRCARDA
jgi:iron(II)-dependent oxidoreductase